MVKLNILLTTMILSFFLVFSGCSSSGAENELGNSPNNIEDSVEIMKENGEKTQSQIDLEKIQYLIEDGEYSENIIYESPAGKDSFALLMNIQEGIVKSIDLEIIDAHDVSTKKINSVNIKLKEMMEGKSLVEVNLPDIIASGASLTSKAVHKKLKEISQ